MNGWKPFSKSALPEIDRPIETCSKSNEQDIRPFSATNVHKYVAFYGDSETSLWRYKSDE